LKKLLLLFLILINLFSTINAYSPLESYGIIVLKDKTLGHKLSSRLNAKGSPVFLVSNIRKGLIQGDMIRFRDKVILIDGDVWQTLKNEGILNKLKKVPVISLKARAKSSTWKKRKNMITNRYEKKGYLVGGEILKILEDYFRTVPSNMDMVISFNGKNMTLTAPYSLLKSLRYTKVRRVVKKPKIKQGTPQIVSLPPEGKIFKSKEFGWTAWGIDPADPSGKLTYSSVNELPKGLFWDNENHSITGIPDSAGTFEVSIKVKNTYKKSSIFTFNLTIIKDKAPTISGEPKDAYPNDIWSFKPFISDEDNYISEINSYASNLPKGMSYNKQHKMFYWKIPKNLVFFNDTINYQIIKFKLTAFDPMNDSTSKIFKLKIFKPKVKVNIFAINIKLPVDTIIQGKNYSWPDSTWLSNEYKLIDVKGNKYTSYKKNKDSIFCLDVKPYDDFKHIIDFTFNVNGKKIKISKSIPVEKNLPPIFVSKMTTNLYDKDQKAFYKPILVDKENDRLIIHVHDNSGKFIKFVGDEFKLNTSKPGNYSYEITATDEIGNITKQIINYTVLQKNMTWTGVKLSNLHRDNWNLYYEGGNIRSGIFFADVIKTFENFDFTSINSPFIFVGANLLGKEQASKGNTLFFDGGITLRNKSKRITSGGILGRLETNIENINKSKWEFEGLIQMYAKQAILILDTSNLSLNEFKNMDRETLTLLANGSLIDGVKTMYPPLGEVLEEYGDQSNVNILLKLQSWYPIKYGFWIGPIYWYENRVTMLKEFQYFGLSIRHKYVNNIFLSSQSLRFGFNGKNFNPTINWDLTLGIGKKL